MGYDIFDSPPLVAVTDVNVQEIDQIVMVKSRSNR